MSLLMNPNRAIEAPVVPSHSNPSLRETIKKREVEVIYLTLLTLTILYLFQFYIWHELLPLASQESRSWIVSFISCYSC